MRTYLYRSGDRRGTALDATMAAPAELGSIQLTGDALAQADPRRTQALDASALVAFLKVREENLGINGKNI